jgi:hypothetical protein
LIAGILSVLGVTATACTVAANHTGDQTIPVVPTILKSTEKPSGPQSDQIMSGPYTHRVESASSPDGLNWTRDSGVRLEHASVPCAIADDQRIVLYYVDADRTPGKPETVGCSISYDSVEFQKQPFSINGLPTLKAVDPCVLRDGDGKYRLYYLASNARGDPAQAVQPHEIHLALSDDGIYFNEVRAVFSYAGLVDPDVFVFNNTWFMYVFSRNQTIIATSQDGYNFVYRQPLSLKNWGTVAPVRFDDGRLRLYAFEQGKGSGNIVASFVSKNGFDWTAENGSRLVAAADELITDPYVVKWQDNYKMYFKVENRAPSAGPGLGGMHLAFY